MTTGNVPGETNVPPGLIVFDALRAEDEPWLDACYVRPNEFPLMAGIQSALIFGASGSGKTALRRALERAWGRSEQSGGWLMVEWPVNALVGARQNVAGSPLAALQQAQVYDAVARVLLRWLGQHPNCWQNAPATARTALAWFTQRFLLGSLSAYVAALAEDATIQDPAALAAIAAAEPAEQFSADAPPILIMTQLMEALNRLGLFGIRILVDNVEPWWEVEPERLTESLYAFLSILAFFESTGFTYKMFLPVGLASRLNRATCVARRRVGVYHLNPSEAELVAIVERRLAAASGRPGFALADLGPADALRAWLVSCGGPSPRGWLETVRPFAAAYLAQASRTELTSPLTLAECRDVQRRHPPRVTIDPQTDEVTVGWRRIEGLGQGHLGLLRYLLDHAGQLCSRKQLYKAYVEAYPGEHADPEARPTEYAAVLDSALWRLRDRVEPIPDTSILLETQKGQGVLLRSW